MSDPASTSSPTRPATWSLVLAFTLVYVTWGTTYLAIKAGVHEFPPALFGGLRIALAGMILLGFVALRGGQLTMPRCEFLVTALVGVLLFVGGNGLVTAAEV